MNDHQPCVCGRLRRASRALTRLYDEALEPVELTVTQFSVMRCVERLEQPTLVGLAEETGHEKSALWRILQPLVKRDWVHFGAVPDARGRRLELTATGRERLALAMPRWRAAQERVSLALGPREASLVALLKEVETRV